MKAREISLVASFLEALSSETGASSNTLTAYRCDLSDYEAHLRENGTDPLRLAKAMYAHILLRGALNP